MEKDEQSMFDDDLGSTDTAPPSILSDKEIAAAQALARQRIEKAMKEAETERVIAAEMERIRREEGKRTGKADLDEEVSFTLDLAEFADKIVINGEEFHHGFSYTVARHRWDSIREIVFRMHVHEAETKGKNLTSEYRRRHENKL